MDSPTGAGSPPLVLVERRERAAFVTINRPEAANALSKALVAALTECFAALAGDVKHGSDVRAVVVTGAGRAFCAGADLKERRAMTLPETWAFLDELNKLANTIAALPLPVIAAINGAAFGGGLELALACDLRIAVDGILLGMPPAKLGLVYSHTGLRRFLDAIGAPRTRELFIAGHNIDARTALSWGLVNQVVGVSDLEGAALDLAQDLAANAPLSVRGNKRAIRELLAAEGQLDPDVERELVELREASFHSEDMREGVRAFGEKRPARWRGR
jgi:enoyl-CoA hydratase/carnithine racemase